MGTNERTYSLLAWIVGSLCALLGVLVLAHSPASTLPGVAVPAVGVNVVRGHVSPPLSCGDLGASSWFPGCEHGPVESIAASLRELISADTSDLLSGLRGKHIVFVGDDAQRMMYDTLTFALEYGHFPRVGKQLVSHPNMPPEVGASAVWESYFNASARLLGGREICDCYHDPQMGYTDSVVENRY